MGDINLSEEIRLNGQSGVTGRSRGAGVRRMYSAKLEGRDSGRMTVAMYRGDGAEEVSSHKAPWVFFWNDYCRNGDSMLQNTSRFGD